MNINKLKALLHQRDISQKEMAEKIGMSEPAMSNAMRRGDFKVATLEKIAKVLNVNMSVFFNDDPVQNTFNEPKATYKTSNNSEIEKLIKERDDALKQYKFALKSINYLLELVKDEYNIDLLADNEPEK
jgi:transcriptional regulator with XRE-family HTH domain